jgi:hypothetical protein
MGKQHSAEKFKTIRVGLIAKAASHHLPVLHQNHRSLFNATNKKTFTLRRRFADGSEAASRP